MQSDRVFRVFISSTFDDLKAEREALQRNVFPKLRERCRNQGYRFQAIDLRWGISHEASLDHRTMAICLEEIRRCREVTPRPNFIVLLGNRYGWCPLPAEIDASSFATLTDAVEDSELRAQLEDWYRYDDNARVPLRYLRERSGRFVDQQTWEDEVETPLHDTLLAAVRACRPGEDIERLFASAIEQEIFSGVLSVADPTQQVFCFSRHLAPPPSGSAVTRYIDEHPEHRERLGRLRERLEQTLGANVRDYQVGWRGDEPSIAHLDTLCDDVLNCLWEVISGEIDKIHNQESITAESESHRRFADRRAQVFIGRQRFLARVNASLCRGNGQLLGIYGDSGCGKSALSGELARRIRESWAPTPRVIERYVGATADSVDIRQLLRGICAEITGVDKSEQDFSLLVKDFRSALLHAGPERPLVVIIDALDQLAPVEQAPELAWLPSRVPDNVHILVTTTAGEQLTALAAKIGPDALLRLKGMTPRESQSLLDHWLGEAGRTLTIKQRAHVEAAFKRCNLPFYFQLAFQEVRRWRSDRAETESGLEADIPGLINQVLDRLSRDDQHGQMIVSRSLAYLAAARSGLTEDELLDVLSGDDEVVGDIERRSFHKLPERRLPVVIWSRLYFDLEHYLSPRSADGATVLSFFHRQLEDVARTRFLAGREASPRSAHLARYFESRRLEWRGVAELPHAQHAAGLGEELERTLSDFRFVEAKIRFAGCQALADDYDLLASHEPSHTNDWWRIVQQALTQSALSIDEDRSLLAGQLLGRLRRGIGTPVDNLLDQARAWRRQAWLSPVVSSLTPPGPLLRTLTHDGTINSTALTRDGGRLVSASSDHTVRIWDTRTGAELQRLEHERQVTTVAISPNQKQVVSYCNRSIRTWDMVSGVELSCFSRPRMPAVYKLAVSADGTQVTTITASAIRRWNLVTGATKDIRIQSRRGADLCADGSRVVISQSSQVRFYDLDTGYQTSLAVTGGIDCATISGDGSRVLISADSGLFQIWDIEDAATGSGHINVGLRAFCLSISHDGSRLLAILGNGMLCYADLNARQVITAYPVHGAWDARMPDDGSFAVTAIGRRSLQLWDLTPGAQEPPALPHSCEVTAVAISPGGDKAVSASSDGTVLAWGVEPPREPRSLAGHEGKVTALAFDPDGTRFVSAGADQRALLSPWAEGEPVESRLGAKAVKCAALSKGGAAVAVSGARNGDLRLWPLEEGGTSERLKAHGRSVRAIAISPDGRYLASSGGDRSLCRWDLMGERMRTTHSEKKGVIRHIAISADGRRTICGLGRSLRIVDPVSGQMLAALQGHTEPVRAVAINANGTRAVSVGRDGRLFLWNTNSGKRIASFRADSAFTSVDLSADGATIIAGDETGAVHLLRLT